MIIKRTSDIENYLNPNAIVPEARALRKLNTNIMTKSSTLNMLTF